MYESRSANMGFLHLDVSRTTSTFLASSWLSGFTPTLGLFLSPLLMSAHAPSASNGSSISVRTSLLTSLMLLLRFPLSRSEPSSFRCIVADCRSRAACPFCPSGPVISHLRGFSPFQPLSTAYTSAALRSTSHSPAFLPSFLQPLLSDSYNAISLLAALPTSSQLPTSSAATL
eukprot:CAMPEP_0198734032 /NCGR_PEP_ID=MMETSP1475-20131203/50118_1 /TAXON_ID= ORGANISM="Unidentified sp., Strain CCMP1999" /NCGR_SAMPLE_ID=MMETSP1475 /ASSEMBLY_ACC=CAM_ASM_001111 /LENGTH=172 /DNA_ID=CAMNT_0044497435 /DNA_START=851 /DNA_END=1369 /DNA_ORIENTATION=+